MSQLNSLPRNTPCVKIQIQAIDLVSMIFGTKNSFAIEALLEPDLSPPCAVWGRMCLWIDSEMLGDIDNPYCALYTSAKGMRTMAKCLESLWDSSFDGLTDEERFQLFDRAIYLDDERSIDEAVRDASRYGRFDFLTNWGEHFDPLKGFLAFDPHSQKVLMMIRRADESLLITHLDRDQFYDVAISFAEWFDAEAACLRLPIPE